MALKKLISYWLMPLPFCLLLLLAGWWLSRTPRRGRLGRRLLGAGIILLFIFGNKMASDWLVRPLERRYPAIPELSAGALPPALAGCRYIAVLGSGNGSLPGLAATTELSPAGIARLVEAVRLLRVLPRAELIVSGPGDPPRSSHARILAGAAVSLGIAPGRIHLVETGHDTEEEAAAIRAIVGDAKVGVVTSAWHMPRAMALFRRAGANALACPADYADRDAPGFDWDQLSWDVDSLARSTAAVHERLGMLWLRIKGSHANTRQRLSRVGM